MKVYLCGGINGLSDSNCIDWREYAKARLLHGALDPMRRDYRGKEDESVNEIVKGDLDDIERCPILLVNATRPSWGTAMEIVYAFGLGKRIVSWVGDSRVSPWLRYHSSSIHASLDAAIAECNR
jgi:nucleoside 2-deoxyribosyltransferase